MYRRFEFAPVLTLALLVAACSGVGDDATGSGGAAPSTGGNAAGGASAGGSSSGGAGAPSGGSNGTSSRGGSGGMVDAGGSGGRAGSGNQTGGALFGGSGGDAPGAGGSLAGASSGGAFSGAGGMGGMGGAGNGGQAGGANGGAGSGGSSKGGQAGASTGGAGVGGAGAGGAAGNDPASTIRVQVSYDVTTQQYKFGAAVRERSGTAALQRRAVKADPLGSFIGTVLDPTTQAVLYQQTIGIGYYYRELTRALSFRFPARTTPFIFRMTAENATSGKQEEVVKVTVDPATLTDVPTQVVQTQLIKQALMSPKLIMPFYAEGYLEARKDAFFKDAKLVSDTMTSANFPGAEHFEIVAVWMPSNHTLGDVGKAGVVPKQDTALGLSFPVWSGISGPDLIIYPTDEGKLRSAFAQVPYDYPVVVVDDTRYWGVGNYNMYTAVPAHNQNLKLLITHEMGHFFGLNEEYSGQDTELAFAPGTSEPWSQNITFKTQRSEIKWGDLMDANLAIPTPTSSWTSGKKIGAYRGGYPNDSRSMIPVPDGVCVMSSGPDFCAVCRRAILAKASFDSE
jgi:hypothetical protein